MIINFLGLSCKSIVLGAAVGLLSALVLKHFDMAYNAVSECTVMLMFAYLSYLAAEQQALSGIISMFSCGLFMAHYTYFNVSPKSQQGSELIVSVMSGISQSFLYIYLGLSAFSIDP